MSRRSRSKLVSDHVQPHNLMEELLRLNTILEQATSDYGEAAYDFAIADDAYRKAKAVSYLAAITDDKRKPRKEQRTIPALEATQDIECEQERLQERLCKARKEACKEKVESCRAQLNALQSISAMVRSEMELAGKAPR